MDLLDRLDSEYLDVHVAKEDAFWTALMGLSDDPAEAHKLRAQTEIAWTRWLSDAGRLKAVKAALGEAFEPEDRHALSGWFKALSAHAFEKDEDRNLSEAIVAAEAELGTRRGELKTGYEGPDGFVPASGGALSTLIRTATERSQREAAWRGLRAIEEHVLDHGFVELVRQRNELGRRLGGEDHYDARTQRVEGLSRDAIFALLEELEQATREPWEKLLESLRAQHGDVQPWDLAYLLSGDSQRRLDPYFPFASALDRWGRSFEALGIDYRGAEITVDLVEREGKHNNGFMHGPRPAWVKHGAFQPARIQFTANAVPGQVGSGLRAMTTLFHEGGHAAHFANIEQPSPIFGQEFAPTSAAFAETQSMLLDSLLDDPVWRARYARDLQGRPIPEELMLASAREQVPSALLQVRGMLAICFAERDIYAIPETDLSGARILEALRSAEQRCLRLERGSARPALSVPHLISGEATAYYHAYVLAEMAVEQTRNALVSELGSLVDNDGVGPALRDAYWKPGNSRSFFSLVEELTGEPPSAQALAERLSRDPRQLEHEASEAVLEGAMGFDGPVWLGFGALRVVHGRQVIGEAHRPAGFAALAERFADWVTDLEG